MVEPRPSARARALLPLAAAAFVAGCAYRIPAYVPPTGAAQAQLVMRGDVQAGEAYGVYLFQDPAQCAGLQQVGIGVAGRSPETTTIAPRLHTVEVFVSKPNRSICRVRWSFEPVAGRKYVVAAASTPTGCRAQILDATDPHRIVAEPTSRRRDVGGRTCVPLAETVRVADAESRSRVAAGEADLPIAPAAPARAAATKRPAAVGDDDLRDLQGRP